MADLKQIQYFAACSQTESFSKAAEILYTTQSSVSKVIKSFEEELGCVLFERFTRGIRLTKEGEYVYQCTRPILENLQKIQNINKPEEKDVLSVSCNPSSWFADVFVQFYQKNKHIHYQVYSADSREIIERVREHIDDLGFVYVLKKQLPAFQYFLSRNYLEFNFLKTTDITMYPGAEHPCWKNKERDMSFSGLKLIQRFPDEFSPDNYWNILDEEGNCAKDAETVITTNSDYIMERILQVSDLVNISGGYLSGEPWKKDTRSISFTGKDNQVLFGYLKRQNETLTEWPARFLEFIMDKINNSHSE